MRTPAPRPVRRAPRPSTFPVGLGDRIRQLRLDRGWSQRDFAAYANLSFSQLSKYESGIHMPPLRTLIRIARLFGLPLDAVLPDSELPPDSLDARLLQRLRRLSHADAQEKEATLGLLDFLFGVWSLFPEEPVRPSDEQPRPQERP
jgi:transcriptional regulator with XRE-family HTH domain